MLIPDLERYFGIDLRQLWSDTDPLDPAWVLMHITALPMESAFMAALRGGQHFTGWDQGRYMQARLIDQIAALNYTLILVYRDRDKPKPDPPKPYPLPDDLSRAKRAPKAGSFAAVMLGHMNKVRKVKAGELDG